MAITTTLIGQLGGGWRDRPAGSTTLSLAGEHVIRVTPSPQGTSQLRSTRTGTRSITTRQAFVVTGLVTYTDMEKVQTYELDN